MSRPSYAIGSFVFVRCVSLAYLSAFLSLWVQVEGLFGSRGVLPVSPFLSAVFQSFGVTGLKLVPTVFWLSSSDVALHVVCAIGTLLSLLVLLGFAPVPGLAFLWALQLSFVSVGRDFLSFQWDNLLLEAGFLAILVAPLSLRHRLLKRDPPRLALWLLWGLLFRLMLASGLVKLLSGDPTWRNLTALTHHYQTQPLPTVPGWWAHQLPPWFQTFSCAVMLGVEILAPVLVLTPWRSFAFVPLVGLQLLIALTGNYAFFNLLTISLCFLLLPDTAWPRALRERARDLMPRFFPKSVLWGVGAPLLALSLVVFTAGLGLVSWPSFVLALEGFARPYRTVNAYGLFAVMTTERDEIVIEGSNDGVTWRTYEFRWKPGDPMRAPGLVAPHQPRLDWQMWFAALGNYEDNRWFMALLKRLLEGEPSVLRLLETNPFPDAAPRWIRASFYEYRFTTRAEHRASGAWWVRTPKGLYAPRFGLEAKESRDSRLHEWARPLRPQKNATIRSGSPEPPAIFIGSAATQAPVSGSSSRFERFSRPGTFAAAATWCTGKSFDGPWSMLAVSTPRAPAPRSLTRSSAASLP